MQEGSGHSNQHLTTTSWWQDAVLQLSQAQSKELLHERLLRLALTHTNARKGYVLWQSWPELAGELTLWSTQEEVLATPKHPQKPVSLLEESALAAELQALWSTRPKEQEPSEHAVVLREQPCLRILLGVDGMLLLLLEPDAQPPAPQRVQDLQILGALSARLFEGLQTRRLRKQESSLYKMLLAESQMAKHELQQASEHQQELQHHLLHSEKMSNLGNLLAGVAHEINNPVNFTHNGAQNVNRRLHQLKALLDELITQDSDDSEARAEVQEMFDAHFAPLFQNLSAILEGTSRIQSIIHDLRSVTRESEKQHRAHIIEGLRSTMALLSANYKKSIDFSHDFQADPEVFGWPSLLNQVFMNILVNAAQAIEDKQKSLEKSEEKGLVQVRSSLEGGHLVLQFEDNGCGIQAEVEARMFEPFFTTKEAHDGTGLGLSISSEIIEKHQGHIEVRSTPDQGTCITIRLPVAAPE